GGFAGAGGNIHENFSVVSSQGLQRGALRVPIADRKLLFDRFSHYQRHNAYKESEMNTPAALDAEHRESRMTPPGMDPNGNKGKSHWWVWLLVFAVIGYGGYHLYRTQQADAAAAVSKKADMHTPRMSSIVATRAWSGNLPIYLNGLGSVAAYNTVTVKARVDGLLTSIDFQEGQLVHKGDVLATIDPRPYQVALDQGVGNLAKDEAALKDAQVNLERDRELYKDQIIAKQQFDTQAASVGGAQGSIESDQAAIASAKLNLSFCKIVAPLTGRIGLQQVNAGNIVHAADTGGIAVITQLQPINVLFSLPEQDLQKVLKKLYAGIKLRAEAYDRNNTTRIAIGTLTAVDNEIDQTTGTSKLKAVFPNEDNALFPNQFVNVKLLLDIERGVVIIPMVAVQRGPIGTYVYLVKPDKSVTVQPVTIGDTQGNDVAIEKGLQPGDPIVVDGADKLAEGMKVEVRMTDSAQTARRQG
ncbi:MAG TPA: efflux RND transporter periplasmic adaptor subunit, partial [Bryobacteraceae bacterium]|nr:efflux RND transporter periplasmic adaptor subunit [Bryobacteraceae bacterium]